ncbi:MAG: histidine kinase [Candidatus Dormiibacterota bacterium]
MLPTARRIRVFPLIPGLPRGKGWLPAAIATLLVAIGLLLFVLNAYSMPVTPGQPWFVTVAAQVCAPGVAAAAVGVVGALIVQRSPRHGFAWLLLGIAVTCGLTMASQEYAVLGLVTAPGVLPGAAFAAFLQQWLFPLIPFEILILLLIFPTGALFSRWVWIVVGVASVATLALMFGGLDIPGGIATNIRTSTLLPITSPPALWPVGAVFDPVYEIASWIQAAMPLAGAFALFGRLFVAKGAEREQLRWVALAGFIAGLGFAINYLPFVFITPDSVVKAVAGWGSVVWIFGICIAAPVAAGIAILRYHLFDIDRVLAQALLYFGLALFVTVLYVGVVVGVGSRVGSDARPALSVLVTVIVALGLAPLRERLQVLANRLVYGRRATPLEVLSELTQAVEMTPATEDVLPRMAELLGDATGSESAEVWLHVGSELRLAAHWPPLAQTAESPATEPVPVSLDAEPSMPQLPGRTNVVPVRYGDELLGCLTVTKRPGDRLSTTEAGLFEALAAHAGLALRNVRLLDDLRSSRQRVLTAGQEQRRRLERDLHDGAQQHLVTASLALGLARSQLEHGAPDDLARSLDDAARQLRSGLAELRDLARGLYPALLTQAGLEQALAALADRAPLPVELDLHLDGKWEPIVETTAYYVVSEALTNVAKHADASRVRVSAEERDLRLVIEIEDDGKGGAEPGQGSGLLGLEDRVATLGGTLMVDSPSGEGTRLRAELPCG